MASIFDDSPHNRTLGAIHGVIGALMLMGLLIAAILEVRRRPSDAVERLHGILYVLLLPLLHLLTSYGVFTLSKWGRILALILSILYVWVFPLGTLLAIYTWWILFGETGRRLYSPDQPEELNKR
jgi:Ca2+/Na+ antiporter